ncbi:hypothetical protein ACLKA6_018211 [Drosophila palustris]
MEQLPRRSVRLLRLKQKRLNKQLMDQFEKEQKMLALERIHSKERGSDRISAEDEAGEKTRNADKYQSHMRATPPNGMLIFIKIASPASLSAELSSAQVRESAVNGDSRGVGF